MIAKPLTHAGYKLFHEGCIALSQVEANGLCIDTKYLARAKKKCRKKIKKLNEFLVQDKIYKKWYGRYGSKTNLQSREQLGVVLFDIMKQPCTDYTPTGRPVCDDYVLRQMKLPFVQQYLEIERWKKALNTFLKGIEKETINGYLHPFYNLNIAASFRSSSDSPNSQNWPVRNPIIAKLIRSAFIPRSSDRYIGEFDFKGVEVATSACYNQDPTLIKYVSDSKTDMHRDMACECYLVTKKTFTKDIRYCAKNRFTFPEFYGNWYKAVAKDLWRGIDELNLCTTNGTSLKKHLRKKGIKRLGECDPDLDAVPGTFEYHIKEVEKDFWQRRFKVYNQWKKDWYNEYVEHGYFDTLTGFRCSALMDRKQCVNYPIQGSAFHCLLWCLIRIQKLLQKYKMKSLIIGQIHDSIVMDILKREMKDVFNIVRQVTTIDLANHWRWINVPMTIEAEIAPLGCSWYEKKETVI
jgi:DNA polymerase-1